MEQCSYLEWNEMYPVAINSSLIKWESAKTYPLESGKNKACGNNFQYTQISSDEKQREPQPEGQPKVIEPIMDDHDPNYEDHLTRALPCRQRRAS